MANQAAPDGESADERTIRLLHEEVRLLRKRASHSDKGIHRIEAIADATAARFIERRALDTREIALLRQRVSHSHGREHKLKGVVKAAQDSAAERGALLDEVNHRAKNSIQMAIALLTMQRHSSSDPQVRLSLASAVERLGHIARVHAMLYETSPDQQELDFDKYLKSFCGELRDALEGDVDISCDSSGDLSLDPTRAINLALVTSEGVTNALKHAFPDGTSGSVKVEFTSADGTGTLDIRDNGIGLPAGLAKNTMGLKLIRTLVKAIDGKLKIDSAEGTHLQVKFAV